MSNKDLIVKELFNGVLDAKFFLGDIKDSKYYYFDFSMNHSDGRFGNDYNSFNYMSFDEPLDSILYKVEDNNIVAIAGNGMDDNILPFFTKTLSDESLNVFHKLFSGLNVKYLTELHAQKFNLSEETTNKPYYVTIGIDCDFTNEDNKYEFAYYYEGCFCTLEELNNLYLFHTEREFSCGHEEHYYFDIKIFDAKTLVEINHKPITNVSVTISFEENN